MPRTKKTHDEVSQPAVRALARRIQDARRGMSQEKLGEWLGIKQGTASKILGTIREEKPKPYPLGRKLAARLADKFDTTLEALERGTSPALAPSTKDMIQNRGLALDFLAGPEFGPELIMALRQAPAPDGYERWTPGQWAEHFVLLKNAWQSGVISLPGMPARKR